MRRSFIHVSENGPRLPGSTGLALLDVVLSPPHVELDLLQPLRPGKRCLGQGRSHWLDEGDFTQHIYVGNFCSTSNASNRDALRTEFLGQRLLNQGQP